MIFLMETMNWLLSRSALTIIVTIIVYYIAKFYTRIITNYPPGPFPLPYIGNIYQISKHTDHFSWEVMKYSKKYGPVFTLWIGPEPVIFICDMKLAKEAFNKPEFSGRPESSLSRVFNNENHQDIGFNDYNRTMESLRRVTHSTVNKYAKTEQISQLIEEVIEKNVELMKVNGNEIFFYPRIYIYNIFANIISSSVFSQKLNIEDKAFKDFKYLSSDAAIEMKNKIVFWEYIPALRYVMSDPLLKFKRIVKEKMNFLKDILEQHSKTFDKTNKRDFCDIFIDSKLEAIDKEKQSAPYLTDGNLTGCMIDLYIAGVETSQKAFQWILLFMIYYPEYQEKLRNEINTKIGDRMPVKEDRYHLNYVMAYISEALRIRNTAPFGNLHRTIVTTKLDKYVVPENTKIIFNHHSVLMDDKYWSNPEQFNPERFLDENGNYTTSNHPAYLPFGVGRRVCIGDKFTYVELLFVLVRFLQLTNEFDIILDPNDNSPDVLITYPGYALFQHPREFKIALKNKNI